MKWPTRLDEFEVDLLATLDNFGYELISYEGHIDEPTHTMMAVRDANTGEIVRTYPDCLTHAGPTSKERDKRFAVNYRGGDGGKMPDWYLKEAFDQSREE